ncbi:unnamed protein product, partial [Ectocarpus fasciculatus]
MSCRFPGMTGPAPEEYYAVLCTGENLVSDLPKQWLKSGSAAHNPLFPKGAVFLNEAVSQSFDPSFFGIGDAEANLIDPHQRLLLELAHEALSQANAIPNSGTGDQPVGSNDDETDKKVGVFVGLCNNEWMGIEGRSKRFPGSYTGTAVAQSSAANRLSFTYGLTGPSMVVDTACSSSLTAIHVACNALRAGDCTHALVAAADLMLSPYSLELRAASHMLSPDSACKTFDAAANGYVRGEGGGAVVLRRLSDVEAERVLNAGASCEKVHGVIMSTSVNQDGKSASFTAPNGLAQRNLITSALESARVDPQDVAYIETHGTGTSLGDPVEWGALREAFRMQSDDCDTVSNTSPIVLGAVKSNIGHLEGAAGMAGLIKVILSLQAAAVPGNRNLTKLNPLIDLNGLSRTPIFPNKLTPLKPSRPGAPLIAGLSSFGSGGTNVHVIVRNYDDGSNNKVNSGAVVDIDLIRKRSYTSANISKMKTKHVGLRTRRHSSSLIKDRGLGDIDNRPRISFMFTGQGSQHVDMGLELFTTESIFRNVVKSCSDAVDLVRNQLSGVSPSRDTAESLISENPLYAQCSLFAYEVALTKLWRSRGVDVNACIVGHSLGEFAGLVAAGVLTLHDAAVLVARRAHCIHQFGHKASSGSTSMVAVRASYESAVAAVHAFQAEYENSIVNIAARNGPKSVVLSGHKKSVLEVAKKLSSSYKELTVSHAFHSALLHEAAEAFGNEVNLMIKSGVIKFISPRNGATFISSVSGKPMTADSIGCGAYWKAQMLQPVNFYGTIQTLSKLFPCHICIEVGPRPDLMKLAPACVSAANHDDEGTIRWIGSSSPIFCKSGTSNTRAQFDAAVTSVFRQNDINLSTAAAGGGRGSPLYVPRSFPWRVLDPSVMLPQSANVAPVPSSSTLGGVHNQSEATQLLVETIRDAILSVLPNPVAASHLSLDSSLLSLGIDSLGAIEVRNRIFTTLHERYDIPSTLLLTHPSITMVVNFLKNQDIDRSMQKGLSGTSETLTSEESGSDDEELSISADTGSNSFYDARDIAKSFPATRVQQAMIYHHMASPEGSTFVETFSWRVSAMVSRSRSLSMDTLENSIPAVPSSIDFGALRRAWMDVAIEHSCLRSSFDTSTSPVKQLIWRHSAIGFDANRVGPNSSIGDCSWFEVSKTAEFPELSDGNSGRLSDFISKAVREHRSRPFDLAVPPLFRVKVIEFTKDDSSSAAATNNYLLLFTAHHSIMDGRSVSLITESLAKHYRQRSEPGTAWSLRAISRAPSFVSFARKEVELVSNCANPVYAKMLKYWGDILSGWTGPYLFKNMPPLAVNLKDTEVIRVRRDIDDSFLTQLRAASSTVEVTIASFVHAACDRLVDHILRVHHQLVNGLMYENFPLTEMQLPKGVSRSEMTSLIVDFQQNDWDCELLGGADDEFSSESVIKIHSGQLFDRICCPLTIRIISTNGSISLFATSECRSYDEPFLYELLAALERVLVVSVDEVVKHGKMSPLSVSDVKSKAGICVDTVQHFPPPVFPAAPPHPEFPSVLYVREKICDGTWKMDNVDEIALSAGFALIVSRWSSSPQFSVKSIGLTGATNAYHLDSRAFSPLTLESVFNSFAKKTGFSCPFSLEQEEKVDIERSPDAVVRLRNVSSDLVKSDVSSSRAKKKAILFLCLHAAGSNAAQFSGWETELNNISAKAQGTQRPNDVPFVLCDVHYSQKTKLLKSVVSTNLDSLPDTVLAGITTYVSKVLDLICSTDPIDWKKPLDEIIPLPAATEPVSPPCAVDGRLLHEPFLTHSTSSGISLSEAVVGTDASGKRYGLSYQKLRTYSDAVSSELCDAVLAFKAKQGSEDSSCVVAVVMEKGWEQVVGVLSILSVQSTYLPIDARLWPEQRVKQVVEMSGAVAILTQAKILETSGWLLSLGVPVVDVNATCSGRGVSDAIDASRSSLISSIPRADPSDLGYLIYTSGSTGVPKGVCCHHLGAMNTIVDLNERFAVGPSDRVLALSSLSFDLSVYDIFGLLAAGGRVVIPSPGFVSPPDPAEWFDMLSSEGITIWNTVPAFVELLVSHAEFSGMKLPASLRLIFMSGDWVPVTLPARIRSVSACPDIRVISMGGATEAAIWSNMFELGKEGSGLPLGWSSVPYGRPLRNQTMLVLDETYRHCEAWVPGVIYIGGVGVASGYYKDPDRTAYQFVHHPLTGELLFRTGDLGRVRPCGNIEILGREDSQVKVNGFRIELGEIERVLMHHDGVSSAALAVHNNTLCAYVVFGVEDGGAAAEVSFCELRRLCEDTLTDYMVPKYFMALKQLPLSSNGKLQREKLPKPDAMIGGMAQPTSSVDDAFKRPIVQPTSELEAEVRSVVANILGRDSTSICCRDDTFFQLGGNSITAIRLIFQLRKQFECSISVQELFDTPTVVGISASIISSSKTDSSKSDTNPIHVIRLNRGNVENAPIILVNPAGASGLCYSELVAKLNSDIPVFALDDDCVMSGSSFGFRSVEEVAASCLSRIEEICSTGVGVILGGWSYGGVVSSVIANQLAAQVTFVHVLNLVLFDPP